MYSNIKKPEDFQEMFWGLYGEHNAKCFSDEALALIFVKEAIRLHKLVRQMRMDEIMGRLPGIFAWLVAFINQKGLNLQDILWYKYPGICPYEDCFVKETCFCEIRRAKYIPEHPVLVEARKTSEKPIEMPEWQHMFGNIYGPVNMVKGSFRVCGHLAEEIGEVSGAAVLDWLGEPNNLAEEAADVATHLFTFSNVMNVSLPQLVLVRYPGRCDVCGKKKCGCPPRSFSLK